MTEQNIMIFQLKLLGYTNQKISNKYKISLDKVRDILKQFQYIFENGYAGIHNNFCRVLKVK